MDGENVLISTENFGLHGYPPTGYRGNRGWGVLIENPEVAGYFREVFVADTRGGDVVPFTPAQWGIPSPGPNSPFQSRFSPLRVAGATVTPVLSPDTSSEILSLIDRAKDRIEIEQATVRNDSSGRLNPFLAAAINASRRGVFVKILLDGGKYSVEGPEDNDEMAALVNRIANRESLPLTARILEPEAANLVTVHTKGLIVDRTFVLVSSINWNENSPNFNREAGVILENPSLGVYFSSVFDWDWEKAGSGAGDGGPDLAKLALSALVVFILLIFYLRRRR